MRFLPLALIAALALATTAAASRAPSPPVAKAIRSAIHGYINMPNSPAAKDNAIKWIKVSTLDPRYASAWLNSKSAGPSMMVLHKSLDTWWILQFGSSLDCDAAPVAVLKDIKIPCAPPATNAWINNCGPLVSAPSSLVLACADANYSLEKLKWKGWGTVAAKATGSASANDCTPNCAAGHFHSYPVQIIADGLQACGRAKIYTRLTILYPGKRPAGISGRDVHSLTC
ncbi:MAG TPA: hypothetical protein VFW85_02640 [Gaiellaceae bacterium]|nr:hypothetical protein [Gaiellaceae bacterium]